MQPELSIITVNYNGREDTERLIESLRMHLSIVYELIVVDNGSVQNEAVILQQKYPFLKTIRSERNLGFAGGNNLGIKAAMGEYLFFLNNDTFIRDDSVISMIDSLKENLFIGGLSPKILFAGKHKGIQFAGYTPLTAITLRNRLVGYGEEDTGQYEQACFTPYLHGAAMLVRRAAIDKAGLMPEVYFLYYEELDWSLRIRQQGYRLGYHPSATVYHLESRSTGQDSPLKSFYMTRNRLLFAQRNLNSLTRFFSIGYQIVLAIPKSLLQAVLKRRRDVAKAIVRGCIAFFKMNRK